MKHLKTYKLFEAIRNPIQDYVDYFVDEYDFEVSLPELGVCDLYLHEKAYDAVEILKLYQNIIKSIKKEFEILTHFITFGSNSVHIHIKRKIEEEGEWDFQSEAQKVAYDAVRKCLKSGEKLEPCDIREGSINFTKREGNSGLYSWITIDDEGYLKMPILRGWKEGHYTELPFTDLDIKWFKRLLEVEDIRSKLHYNDDTDSEEFELLHDETQEKLREIYK